MKTDIDTNFSFDLPKNRSNVMKVMGIGGGGSNAVNYMYKQGIKGVDFVVCNTDSQALEESPVPNKIQLGVNLTEGLGAGANPEIGKLAALESYEELKNLLETQTKMLFILLSYKILDSLNTIGMTRSPSNLKLTENLFLNNLV